MTSRGVEVMRVAARAAAAAVATLDGDVSDLACGVRRVKDRGGGFEVWRCGRDVKDAGAMGRKAGWEVDMLDGVRKKTTERRRGERNPSRRLVLTLSVVVSFGLIENWCSGEIESLEIKKIIYYWGEHVREIQRTCESCMWK